MSLIDKIIKEAIDVGNVLFGEIPIASRMQSKKWEKNTSIEKEIYNNLENFLVDNEKDLGKALPQLMKLKNKFPEILKPNPGIVYRGTTVNAKVLQKLIKEHGTEKQKKINVLSLPGNVEYTATGSFTSWSYDSSKAEEFIGAYEYDTNGKVGIVLETKVDDSFIFNSNFINRLSFTDPEDEVMSIKKKFQCKIYWEKGEEGGMGNKRGNGKTFDEYLKTF